MYLSFFSIFIAFCHAKPTVVNYDGLSIINQSTRAAVYWGS